MQLKQTLVVMLVAAMLLGAIGWAGAQATNAIRATPTAVAVVDLSRVAENLQQRQQIQADLRRQQEELNKAMQDRARRVQNLQGDLDLLQPNTPAYRQQQEELMKAGIDLQVWREVESRKLRLEEQVQTENLLRKISDAIGRVAQDNGFDVVVNKGQSVNLGQQQDQMAQLNLRYVAWSSNDVDLTDQVIQRMNNEFQAGQ